MADKKEDIPKILSDSLSEYRRNIVKTFLADQKIYPDTHVGTPNFNYEVFVDSLVLFISQLFSGTPQKKVVKRVYSETAEEPGYSLTPPINEEEARPITVSSSKMGAVGLKPSEKLPEPSVASKSFEVIPPQKIVSSRSSRRKL
jgi:hypothetical protein